MHQWVLLSPWGRVDRRWRGHWGCLGARGSDWVGWLPEAIGNWLGIVVLVGWTHGLRLDSNSNGLALGKLTHFLAQVSERSLSILVRVKGDVPEK